MIFVIKCLFLKTLDLVLKIHYSKGHYISYLTKIEEGKGTDKFEMLFNETLLEPLDNVQTRIFKKIKKAVKVLKRKRKPKTSSKRN